MATRAEQFRTQAERQSAPKKKRPVKPKMTRADQAKARLPHTMKSASYALEQPAADGRRSRKSSRSSANRAKPDASFNLREQLVKGSPEARFRKSKAANTRVRGSNG